jgi:Fe-S-cluster containining protein
MSYMTGNDRNTIVKKAEQIALDIFDAGGRTRETVQLLARNLYRFGDKLVDTVERQQNLISKIECKVGCSFCCHAEISLTPAETLLIRNYIIDHYSLKKIDTLMKRAVSNIRLTKGKSQEERIDAWDKTPCIFLEKDKCDIYDVRPFICRAWHSLSVDQCRKAFNTGDRDAEIDSTPYRNAIYGAVREGLSNICAFHGCEWKPVELSSAIRFIVNHPAPDEAWIAGEKLFNP